MDVAMLWYDPSQRDIAARVADAADYYHRKYQQAPNTCQVNPDMLPAGHDNLVFAGVVIRPSKLQQNNHFLIGYVDNAENTTATGG